MTIKSRKWSLRELLDHAVAEREFYTERANAWLAMERALIRLITSQLPQAANEASEELPLPDEPAASYTQHDKGHE